MLAWHFPLETRFSSLMTCTVAKPAARVPNRSTRGPNRIFPVA